MSKMGNLNDFKLVNKISENYFKKLQIEPKKELSDVDKKRLGFYLFILSCVTELADVEDVKDLIIDTDFHKKIYGNGNNDLGIDAVYIDEERFEINLFNFKFREQFKENKTQELNTVSDSVKFLNAVFSKNIDNLDKLTADTVQNIIDKYNSNDIWETKLYLVSNDNHPLNLNTNEVQSFISRNGIQIIPISLDNIVEFISDKPEDLKATFMIDSDSVMTFKDDPKSSSQSYLVKLPLITLIRITCKNEDLRENYTIEDYSELSEVDLDLAVLYDNVRGYLGNTKYNKNILKTIDIDSNHFFMFNNGITITASKITAKNTNANQRFKCSLDGFQVVNGGQTLRTIYKYKEGEFNAEKLSSAEILVRIFQTEDDQTLTNNIAEYTNSQNAISSVDLKSINNIQIKIEEYLKQFDISYIRKIDKSISSSFKDSITMEVMAQLIYSKMGYPEIVTNQKSALFNKYYDEIFHEKLDFDELKVLYYRYKEIEGTYASKNKKSTKQERFYVIWMIFNKKSIDIEVAIEQLEKALKTYKSEESLSPARKIIQKSFKEHLEKEIDMYLSK